MGPVTDHEKAYNEVYNQNFTITGNASTCLISKYIHNNCVKGCWFSQSDITF